MLGSCKVPEDSAVWAGAQCISPFSSPPGGRQPRPAPVTPFCNGKQSQAGYNDEPPSSPPPFMPSWEGWGLGVVGMGALT